jgi:hypothetical protein
MSGLRDMFCSPKRSLWNNRYSSELCRQLHERTRLGSDYRFVML